MTILKLLFSFKGRINRATWWLLTLSIAILNTIIAKLLSPAFPPIQIGAQSIHQADLIASTITFFPVLAIGAKRLHDRNKSGWWLAIYAAPAVLVLLMAMIIVAAPDTATGLVGPLIATGFVLLIMIVWNFIELGFLKGDSNANDFGHPWKMSDLLDGTDEDAMPAGGARSETALAAEPSKLATASRAAPSSNASPVKVRVGKPQAFGRRPVSAR